MGAYRTLCNNIGLGRSPSTRKKGSHGLRFSRVKDVEKHTLFTAFGPHTNGVANLRQTEHEAYNHPTKGRRWRRVG